MDIIDNIREGGEAAELAYAKLFEDYSSYMEGVCSSVLKNRTIAKDLVPAIISDLPNLINKLYNPRCKLKTFLFKTCYYYSMNAKRVFNNYVRLKVNNLEYRSLEVPPSIYSLDVELVRNREREVLKYWDNPEYHDVYYLKNLGFTFPEISARIGVKEGTCRRRYHDIKKRFKEDTILNKIREEIFA